MVSEQRHQKTLIPVACPEGKIGCEVWHGIEMCASCQERWPCRAALLAENEQLRKAAGEKVVAFKIRSGGIGHTDIVGSDGWMVVRIENRFAHLAPSIMALLEEDIKRPREHGGTMLGDEGSQIRS